MTTVNHTGKCATWHLSQVGETINELRSSVQGLSSTEAEMRLGEFGKNEFTAGQKKSLLLMILSQFKDIFILILLIAAVIAVFAGDAVEVMAIIAIVILNAVIGCIQEYRAEKALQALRKIAAPEATVIRDGFCVRIPAAELVPGDIVVLDAGNIVPADMRLIEAAQLKVAEAALTGESVPVEKIVDTLEDANVPLGDRKNMVFSGTFITYGRGKGIIVTTGMETELGKIAHMLEEGIDERTPLQHRLESFGKRLALAIFVIVTIIFITGLMRGEPIVLMFLTAVSLAVAAIPEALPAVVTISLALGARKMVEQKALIRNLPAVETLGSVTYICSDKTGTLTLNKMTVEKVFCDGNFVNGEQLPASKPESGSLHIMLMAMALSNDAYSDKFSKVAGDPTEVALYQYAKDRGFNKESLNEELPRVAEIPFDSKRKLMTTFHRRRDGKFISFTKGAVESIVERSLLMFSSTGPIGIDINKIDEINVKLAADGLRILGIAMRKWDNLPENISPETIETELVFLGLVGMIDPPRDEAREAVRLCKTAGINPVMITGDHHVTARAIAKRLGITDDTSGIIEGDKLSEMHAHDLEKHIKDIRVYARISPEQKLRIVKTLKNTNQFVAMTGDGVNDAPALRTADIGVAMGITGTDVAKEASDMILLDDNFATLVKAVREGRRIYDNIIKFLTYSLTSNASTLWLIFLAPFFGLPLSLLPIQILWMNLLCDSLPGLALTMESADKNVMHRPPRPFNEGVFSEGRGTFIITFGLIIGMTFLIFQMITVKQAIPWQTMLFTSLVLGRMAILMGVRSQYALPFSLDIFKNKFLFVSIIITFGLQIAVVYFPFLNTIFKTEPLGPLEFLIMLMFSVTPLLTIELKKLCTRIVTRKKDLTDRG